MATFLDAFFPSYKLHLAHAKFFKRLPYEWNDDQKKIVVNPSPLRKASVRAWIILTGAYVSFQIVNITFGEYSLVKKLTGALILNLNAGCFLLSLELNPESTPIENLNRLLSGEGKLRSSHIQWSKTNEKCFLTFLRYSATYC